MFKYDLQELLDSKNIAELLTENDRGAVSAKLKKWYEQDLIDREPWMQVHRDGLKMAAMIKTEKSTPWPGCANMQYPLLAMASIAFGSEAVSTMISGGRLVSVEAVGDADAPVQAELEQNSEPPGVPPGVQPPQQAGQMQQQPQTRSDMATHVENHLNYQLTKQIPGYLQEMRRMLHTLPSANMVHKKIYWNKETGLPASLLLLPQECVVPKDSRPGEPVRRWTHILPMYRNEIQSRINSALYVDSDDIANILKDEDKELFTVLEQHNWLDLDGDGFEEPYICTIHSDSGTLLQILPRFAETHIEYADETEEEEEEEDENEEFETVETDTDNDEREKSVEKGSKIVAIDAVNHLVTYTMLPALDGSYLGMGFSSLALALNNGINTALNQILDAETLSILAGNTGFTAKGALRSMKGDIKVKPGEFKETEMTPEDLQKAFLPWPAKSPDPVIIQTLEFLTKAGERLLSSTEMQQGSAPQPGNQPQVLGLAMMERGGMVYQGVLQGIYGSFQEELQLIVRLNSMYLPEKQYSRILGGQRTGREDYAGFKEFEITPTVDPTAVTKTHQAVRANALLKIMPDVPPPMRLKILAKYCKAIDSYALADELEKMADQPQQPNPIQDAQLKKIESEAMKNQATAAKYQAEIDTLRVAAAEMTAKIQAMGVEVQKIVAETRLIEHQANHEELQTHVTGNDAVIQHHNDMLQGHIDANTAIDAHKSASAVRMPPIGTGAPVENPLQGAFD